MIIFSNGQNFPHKSFSNIKHVAQNTISQDMMKITAIPTVLALMHRPCYFKIGYLSLWEKWRTN